MNQLLTESVTIVTSWPEVATLAISAVLSAALLIFKRKKS